MNVAFWLNAFTNRGVERAVYDYARCYSGQSWIVYHTGVSFHLDSQGRLDHSADVFAKFFRRFGERMYAYSSVDGLKKYLSRVGVSKLYMLCSGERHPDLDKLIAHLSPGISVLIHCVFDASQRQGDRFAAISPGVANTNADPASVPIVPHMVLPLIGDELLADCTQRALALRESLNIAPEQVVVGRYGGWDTFDIPFVHGCIRRYLDETIPGVIPKLVFVVMHTKPIEGCPDGPNKMHYLPGTVDDFEKAAYIDACDVMLHARNDGESFGLAVAEFALRGKHVLTYNGPALAQVYFRNHEAILGDRGLYYKDVDELTNWFNRIETAQVRTPVVYPALGQYSEVQVMRCFAQHFLV